MKITNRDIELCEKLLLPHDCKFTKEQLDLIKCLDSTEILACPGSGKTTILLAKLLCVTNHFPLKNNSGVCVLSHTNVAINEIRDNFGQKAIDLNSYPSFIGTLQTFIDRFVVFPYLTRFTSEHISVLDQERYSTLLWDKAQRNYSKYRSFYSTVKNRIGNSKRINEPKDYIKDVKLDSNRNLLYKGAVIASNGTDSAKQFAELKNSLLTEGITNYTDTYKFALDAVTHFGEQLRSILSKRFRYVFIDEYQDCDDVQRKVIESIFDTKITIVQKIGDVDQAIFNNPKDENSIWKISSDALFMRGSNRYHQAIANEVVKLRTDRVPIISLADHEEITPCLIVYDRKCIDQVIPTFVQIVKDKNIMNLKSKYPIKAIGMIKNGKGITISDYWARFSKKDGNSTNLCSFSSFIQSIKEALNSGDLAEANQNIISLFKVIFTVSDIRTKEGGLYSKVSIRKKLFEEREDYQDFLLNLSKNDYEAVTLNELLRQYIRNVLGKSEFEEPEIQDYLNSYEEKTENEELEFVDEDIKIIFDTVFKTKGETHAATLYLETETSRASDIKRILHLFDGKNIKKETKLHLKSQKVVYVGFSRPSNLLALAIQSSTFEKSNGAFEHWETYHLKD